MQSPETVHAVELPRTLPVACRLPTAATIKLRAAAAARGVTLNDLLKPTLEALAKTVSA
jgi:hypothetical protein